MSKQDDFNTELYDVLNDFEFAIGLDDRHNDVKKEDAKQAILQAVERLCNEVIGEDYKRGDLLDGLLLPTVHRDLLKHEHATQRQRLAALLRGEE